MIDIKTLFRQRPRKATRRCHPHRHETRWIDTGHGMLSVDIFEGNAPPRFRLSGEHGRHNWPAAGMEIRTIRPDGGARQTFRFIDRGAFLESTDTIPAPHAFMARVLLSHDGHRHAYNIHYEEPPCHGTDEGPGRRAGFGKLGRTAFYFFGAVIILAGLYVLHSGRAALA
ncbi:hypothetical protein [Herbaspirillum sp.]|uniref:hypothetical protein n=1 Tax=Herbaspirillum sp. TaxID=1890675 RepID=UPI0031D7C229